MIFLIFFAIQFAQYLIITINMAAVASKKYLWVGISDALICAVGFLIVKHIAENPHSTTAMIGYMLGGILGGQVGVWLSERL